MNAELQSRIDELGKANDDLKNFLDSTDIATVFLDVELRVRRFTPKTLEIIPLVATDAGRPVKHLACQLRDCSLHDIAAGVLDDLRPVEKIVRSTAGRSYEMRVTPYRTINNVIDGVVMTFSPVKERGGPAGKGKKP